MHRSKPALFVLLAAITMVFASGSLVAATIYTTLNDPSATGGTIPNGISGNNIVGQYEDASGNTHGFLYNGSTYTTLNDPSATNGTVANGISGNNIVGQFYLSHSVIGFLYNGSRYTDLTDPSGDELTYAEGISSNNVVGYYLDDNLNAHGFVYNTVAATYTTLNDPLAEAVYSSINGTFADGISGNNVVGCYTDASGNYHGFLYNGSAYTTLDDPLAGGGANQGTLAEAISGNDVVGYFTDASGNAHGFLYNGSTYTTLDDPLGVEGTVVSGISGNNIVGIYYDASGNANGFIATVPEPSSSVLFWFAAVGLAIFDRRRMRRQVA